MAGYPRGSLIPPGDQRRHCRGAKSGPLGNCQQTLHLSGSLWVWGWGEAQCEGRRLEA